MLLIPYLKKAAYFLLHKHLFSTKVRKANPFQLHCSLCLAIFLVFFNFTVFASYWEVPLADPPSSPVVMDGKELFRINVRVGAFTPEERAKAVSEKLIEIAQDYSFDINALQVNTGEDASDIILNDKIILTITEKDAQAEQLTRDNLTQERVDLLKSALTKYREERSSTNIALNIIYAVFLTVALFSCFSLVNKALALVHSKLTAYCIARYHYAFKIQKFEILSKKQVLSIIDYFIRILGYVSKLSILYFYLYTLLSIFPATWQYAKQLLDYISTPLTMVAQICIEYLPNLFIIAFIIFLSHYILKLIMLLFRQIKKGTIQLSGFYIEWCDPTYKIIRFLVVVLTLICIFPYIPGSRSPIFQGMSVLVGILVSLGSTSLLSNIIAGISLTYTRAFTVGDRIQIGDHIGDVLEKSLLVTQIRTIKNVDISIPNSVILNSSIINYSRSSKETETNLILNTQVTIGYDVPWRTVHELLISAAVKTPHILVDPRPFVFQTSLDDFYVSYQINAYTNTPHRMANIYSDLHQNIQDAFNIANVEIMSPHYTSIRDGNQSTIPQENLPNDFIAPAFKIESILRDKK